MVSVRNDWPAGVSDAECAAMAEACHIQLTRDFCPAWGYRTWDVSTTVLSNHIQAHIVKDDAAVPGALAYHDDSSGKPVIVVMGDTILKAGGSVLSGSLSISAALSHEITETRGDELAVYGAYNAADQWEYAKEVANPVESSAYTITTSHGLVSVSNFVLEHWFELGSAGPYDHLRHLSRPFQIEKGGYVVRWRDGAEAQVFNHELQPAILPAWHGWRTLKRVRPSLEREGLIPKR